MGPVSLRGGTGLDVVWATPMATKNPPKAPAASSDTAIPQDEQDSASSDAAPAAPAAPPPPVERPFLLVRGRSVGSGKYRGQLKPADLGQMSGDTRSVFWPGNAEQEVVLTPSAFRECQEDPEIVVVRIRDLTAEEAAAHVQGPVAAEEGIDASQLSDEALEAELQRRRARRG